MKTLREVLTDADARHVAVGHFNISELAALKGIFQAAQELNLPVLYVGVGEKMTDLLEFDPATFVDSLLG